LAECPACSHLHASVSIRDTSDVLVVLVKHGQRRGKAFTADIRGAWPGDAEVAAFQERLLNELEVQLPDSRLPKWSGIVNPALYGIETHAEFVNRRQRAVLLALIKQLQIEFKHLEQRLPKNAAKAVVCLLSGLIDQLVDWNCRLSMWISQNEQVGRAFSGPGIPMLWDYVETDPVSTGPSNLWAKLDRIVSGSKAVEQLTQKCNVRHGYAQQLPYQDEFFDAIVTDPPYYDNVYYSVLSDFFFSWKRILFEKVEPSLFSQTTTDSTRELVASKFRSGDSDQAHSDYCYQLGLAILEAERVLKKDGVFSLLYSHSSLRGWDALVQAYRQTRLRITSVQPLSIERKARPRAMTSDAVNTCVVFVAHRANTEKKRATVSTLCKNLKTFTDTLVDGLENAGWRADDIGVAAFSQGVAMLANISGVSDYGSDMATLLEFEKVVQTRVPEFKVVNRRSL
jgi:putative DNA methylase